MLPFHKRARANSIIELGTDELQAIELPQVRPPSVRPGSFAHRASSAPVVSRKKYDSYDAEEMTVVRMDKRISTSPPPRIELGAGQSQREYDLQPTRLPRAPYVPRFEQRYHDDEPTQAYPSSRPLLSMQTANPRSVIVEQTHEIPPPPASRLLPEAPRSAAAVDPASSAHVRALDMDMTASLSGATDISKLRRPTMGWASALVAVGVFAGIITAFVARGEGLATAAAFIDPSHSVTADVAKAVGAQPQQAQPQAQTPALMPGAGAIQVQSQKASNVGVPSCDANAVPAAKVEVAKVEVKAEPVAKVEKPAVKVVYVAPPVVHHVEAREPAPVVAHVDAPPAITKPVVAKPAHKASTNDMESASAADALAKAQLEASLTR